MAAKITYTQQGNYLLPNLMLPEQSKVEIGIWGKRHLRYIKQYHPIRYTNLLTSCELTNYLANIDEQAEEIYMQIVKRFSEQDGCTEQLKATNPMLWVRKMNNAAQRARAVVLSEIIYR